MILAQHKSPFFTCNLISSDIPPIQSNQTKTREIEQTQMRFIEIREHPELEIVDFNNIVWQITRFG